MRGPANYHNPRRSLTAAILAAAAAMSLAASAPAAERQEFLLTGNEQALWLLRPKDGKAFDLALRQVTMPWKLLCHDSSGTVLAAAAPR